MSPTLPHFYFLLAFISSAGAALVFTLALRVSGKKGYIFLAAAAAFPVFAFARERIDREMDYRSIREEHPGVLFSKEEWGMRDVPWVSTSTLIGAIMLLRSERRRANQSLHPTALLGRG